MKRSGPPARRTPLRAKAPLERHTELRRTTRPSGVKGEPAGGGASDPARGLARTAMKQSRPKPAVPADVRDALRERSSGWCEAQLPGCWALATDPHHRITRKGGGRHGEAKERSDRMSGLLLLCRPCHRWTHEHPAAAEPLGLLLPEGAVTPQIPVLYRGEPVFLGDGGEVATYEAVGT